ncbi:Uncharacterized protein Adt_10357 [Abeliophyllum distichum]|uniref:Uncharacterized protein n=1 Tax=Abeliophyllum distichum TaxID=126358 RepID=A0ABD1ULF1_9LAMI
MDAVIPHETILQNRTRFRLQFSAHVVGFTMPSCRRAVNSSEILNISRHHESARWLIEVLIDEQLSGMKLNAEHFLSHVLIVFESKRHENGENTIVAKGVKDTNVDMFLRMRWVVILLLLLFVVFYLQLTLINLLICKSMKIKKEHEKTQFS